VQQAVWRNTIKYINVIAEKDKPVSVDNPKLVSRKVFSNTKKQEITAYNTKDATSEKFDKVVFVRPGYYASDGRWIEADASGFITELEVTANGAPVRAKVKPFDDIRMGYVIDEETPEILSYISALSKSANNDNAFLIKTTNGELK